MFTIVHGTLRFVYHDVPQVVFHIYFIYMFSYIFQDLSLIFMIQGMEDVMPSWLQHKDLRKKWAVSKSEIVSLTFL